MRGNGNGDEFDAVIDAASRAITAAEPTSALRANVHERIARAPAPSFMKPAWAGGLLVALTGVVMVGRALLSVPDGPANVGRTVAPHNVVVEHRTAPLPSPPPEPARVTARPASRSLVRRVTMPPAEPIVEQEDPLIEPIKVDPLRTQQISVDTSSGVMPIEIEPLQVEPLQGFGQ